MKARPFYGETSLYTYLYYFYLPKLSYQAQQNLSTKVVQYSGDIEDLEAQNFKDKIQIFGDILVFHEDKVVNISHNSSIKDSPLRCILLQDFELALAKLEEHKKLFKKLIAFGLPRKPTEGLVAVLLPNEVKKKTHYYRSEYVPIQKKHEGKSEYDIPMYMPELPVGYSLFTTIEEKEIIIEHIMKEGEDKGKPNATQQIQGEQKEFQPPRPRKEHLYCQLCRKRFKEYFSHLKEVIHLENIKKNQGAFDRMFSTFERIKTFNKTQRGFNLSNEQSEMKDDPKKEAEVLITKQELPPSETSTVISTHEDLLREDFRYKKRKFPELMKQKFLAMGEFSFVISTEVRESKILKKKKRAQY